MLAQSRLVGTDVSGRTVSPIVNGQAKMEFALRRNSEMKRCFVHRIVFCVLVCPWNNVLLQKFLLKLLIEKLFTVGYEATSEVSLRRTSSHK